MQETAFSENRLIFAKKATRGRNYCCPECGKPVRLRSGTLRRPHFFHLKKDPSCRLANKGIIHLHVQQMIQQLLEEEGAVLEHPFPELGRIADIACLKTKKIIEVQYSPMSLAEARARSSDYESAGFTIIWILHDHTYNKKRLQPAENFFRSKICYYTNMNKLGRGQIYDQLEKVRGKRRFFSGYSHPVNLQKSHPLPSRVNFPNEQLLIRAKTWPFCHEGDWIYRAQKGLLPKKHLDEKSSKPSPRKLYKALLIQILARFTTKF